MRIGARGVVLSCVVALGVSPATASAQHIYEPLHSFVEPAFPPMGRLHEAANGRFYGVARNAGAFNRGAVLAYDRQPDGTLASTVIHSFNVADGASPQSALVQGSDGAMYGCAFAGGASDNGTIYRIAPDDTFSLLHSLGTAPFAGPCAELTAGGDGHLYGMSGSTVFRLTTGGVMSAIAAVAGGWPADPLGVVQGGLIDGGDGKLYGIDSAGQGQIFSVTLDGTVTVLHSFSFTMGPFGATGELWPRSFIDGRDGFFYGTTSVFEMPPLGTAVSKVFRISRTGVFSIIFTGSAAFPQQMETLVRGTDGNFYGTTRTGGVNDRGQIFRLTPGGAISTIYSFQFWSGILPNSLMQAADGMLFGSTEQGGLNRRGAIFRSTTTGQYAVMNTLAGIDPLLPAGSLIADSDGTFYGTSCLGGAFNAGTIFRVNPGAPPFFPLITVLHSFAYWDGFCPRGQLAFGLDGALYGTSSQYGLGGRGTIFRITTAGAFTPIYFFNGSNGAEPVGGLVRNPENWNLYGTTRLGGALQGGTIFRVTPAGAVSTVHHFNGSGPVADAFPEAPLMQSEGTIYGATQTRPFRLAPDGTVTLFPPVGRIYGPLFALSSVVLLGAASPVSGEGGILFHLDTATGDATTTHTFTGPDGSHPFAGLQYFVNGWVYGSTATGGAAGFGTLYRYLPGGPVEVVHDFTGADGSVPFARMTLASGYSLYGTTVTGGAGDRGVVFRMRPPQ